MSKLSDIKSIALAVLIAVGLFVQSNPSFANETETLTVAGGCFWCVEADFEKVTGVTNAVSGFTGGNTSSPTYKQVTSGGTGHFEAVQITFDPSIISAGQLLDMFFRSIDPTDGGGQFCDRGDIYRTAIFATSDQETAAERAKAKAQADLGQNIVTLVLPATEFYPADAYHQDYATSSKIILTRFGPKRKSAAYKAYRNACGRDQRVKELWGSAAPFAG